MADDMLYQAIYRFAGVTYALSDAELERDYTWRYHDEGLRFALIGTHHELRALGAALGALRATYSPPRTMVQRVLGQYHQAYRDLQAVLIGVDDDIGAREPAPDEWPITVALAHMHDTARQFFGRAHYAVERVRQADARPLRMADEELVAFAGPALAPTALERSFTELSGRFDALHRRIIGELAGITDDEAQAPSLWWEEEEIPVLYRVQRFEAHVRQHTIQCEKILDALSGPPSEAKRLLRLIYAAVADVEALAIGAPEFGAEAQQAAAEMIAARVDEI